MNNLSCNIFAIIVTYNGEGTIAECLSSIADSIQSVKTIVVENASTDDTSNIIQRFQNLVYLPQERNLGFGQANNIGMRYALEHGADYVFLLNQDASIKEDSIGKLLAVAREYPDYGILSPLHLNGDGSQIDDKVAMYLTKGRSDFLSDTYFNRMSKYYDVRFINAAAWLISADCVKIVGGFDDLFFMYGEDVDYCNRVLLCGFKIGIVPEAVIFHKRSVNQQKRSAWENIKRSAYFAATLIKVDLKKSRRSFLSEFILWRIDHFAKKCQLLVKGHIADLLVLLIAGTDVLINLPKIWLHKKRSLQRPAFWD